MLTAPLWVFAESNEDSANQVELKEADAETTPSPRQDMIYQWQDSKGKTHYGDQHNAPEHAQPVHVPPTNTADRVDVPNREQRPEPSRSRSANASSTQPRRHQRRSPPPSCFSPSALYLRQGDDYFAINPIQLSHRRHQQLQTLGTELSGQWRGSSTELACQGSENDWFVSRQRSAVTATLSSVDNSAFKARLLREANSHFNWRSDQLYLFSYDNLLSLEINDQGVHADEKYRRKTATGSSLTETNTELHQTESSITLDTLYYVNGRFVGRETIHLYR